MAAHQRAPPVADVGTAGKSMTYHQGIVALRGERPSGAVGDGNIVEDDAGFEREVRDNGNVLIWDERGERVLRLAVGSLYGI